MLYLIKQREYFAALILITTLLQLCKSLNITRATFTITNSIKDLRQPGSNSDLYSVYNNDDGNRMTHTTIDTGDSLLGCSTIGTTYLQITNIQWTASCSEVIIYTNTKST